MINYYQNYNNRQNYRDITNKITYMDYIRNEHSLFITKAKIRIEQNRSNTTKYEYN